MGKGRYMSADLIVALLVALLTSTASSANVDTVSKDLVLKNVDRTIDITTQLVKVSNKLTLENIGKEQVKTFLFAMNGTEKQQLAYIGAQIVNGEKATIAVAETKVADHKKDVFWRLSLNDILNPGQTTAVEVELVFMHALQPYPAQIAQKEKQLVIYSGNHYLYTPYKTLEQTTKVLVSGAVESYSKLKPVSQSENTFTYGPYKNVAPFTDDKMMIHYENNSPFLTVKKILRTVEVSHWGNIAVEESIELHHTGAILKGPFSRYEYQREANSGQSSVRSFKTVLPAAAKDVYYRDEIGNISTSHMKILDEAVELELRPRFPLFGGWQTHYILGYNVPSYEYLFAQGEDFVLRMRFIDHIFDDMAVEEAVVRVILPEGSHALQLQPPYPLRRLPDSLHFTYLDTTGRPTLTLRKTNLVENHIQDITLQYRFPRILMLQEPLLVVAAFYLLFVLVIIYVRLDFSISKDDASETRMRTTSCCERILSNQDKRTSAYQNYEDQLVKLKGTKDSAAFQTALKAINAQHKSASQAISEMVGKFKTDAPEVADKVQELQKLDRNLWDLYTQHGQYTEKLVAGKLSKQQFLDLEGQTSRKKEDCMEKINAIVKAL